MFIKRVIDEVDSKLNNLTDKSIIDTCASLMINEAGKEEIIEHLEYAKICAKVTLNFLSTLPMLTFGQVQFANEFQTFLVNEKVLLEQ